MFARAFLNVSRRRVNRRHDRPGRRIGLLARVNGACSELVVLFHVELQSNCGLRGSKRITNQESRKKEHLENKDNPFLISCFPDQFSLTNTRVSAARMTSACSTEDRKANRCA